MAEQPLDPDLQSLMSELGKVEGEVTEEQAAPVQTVPEPVLEPKQEAVEEPKLVVPTVEKTPIPEEVNKFDAEKQRIHARLLGLIDTHCDSAAQIIEDVESDRRKCDDVYNIMFTKLQNNDYRASDAAAIVTVLQTKAEITKTRASMMDSVAKLLASVKNNNTVASEGGGSGDLSQEEVKNLLEKKVEQ